MPRWIETTTLGDLVVRGAATWPDADAIVFPGERRTYRELDQGARMMARALYAQGVRPGDHVGLFMPNSVEYAELLFGTAMLGAVAVLINSRYQGDELGYVIDDADLVLLVTSDRGGEHVDFPARVATALPGLAGTADPHSLDLAAAPSLERIVLLGDHRAGTIDRITFEKGAGEVADGLVEELRARVALRDVGMMMYTSGTTSRPKGCLMTHEMVVRNCQAAGRHRFELTADDRFWDPLPMFHMSAILPIIACLDAGAAWLGMQHFEAGEALRMLAEEKATVAYPSFPTITQALVNHPDFAETDLSRIRLVNNVAPPDTLRRLQQHWPQAIQITAYGCTEIGGVASFNELTDTLDQRVETCGRPFPGIQLRVADPDTGATVATGQRGEIRAKGYSLFEGYHNDRDRTAEAFDDQGWFCTGDIGSMGPDGRISYHGRLKDMLKVGGENVAAAEIEAVLDEHPAVAISQVVGAPDDHLFEVPAAFVEVKPGAQTSAEELIEFCRGRVANFKLPRHIRFVDQWPMSATKIQKYRLRARIAEELQAEASNGREEPS